MERVVNLSLCGPRATDGSQPGSSIFAFDPLLEWCVVGVERHETYALVLHIGERVTTPWHPNWLVSALGLVNRLRLGSATAQVAPPLLRRSRICSPDAHSHTCSRLSAALRASAFLPDPFSSLHRDCFVAEEYIFRPFDSINSTRRPRAKFWVP